MTIKYPKELYEKCDQIFLNRRLYAESELRTRRDKAFSMPGGEVLRSNEAELASSMLGLVRRGRSGGSIADISALVSGRAQDLKVKTYETLTSLGLPSNYLELNYLCKKCGDTGITEGKICSCYENELKKLCFLQLPLANANMGFENFNLDFYNDSPSKAGVSEHTMMRRNLQVCMDFVKDFERTPKKSLLLFGATGLGKTHLSTSISKALVGRGHFVILDMASAIFSNLESEKFGRRVGFDNSLYTACDLLVIDDLGSEFTFPFVISALFTLINLRQLKGLSTIVNTNLSLAQLGDVYGEKIASRLIGAFTPLSFVGTDIRMTKRTLDK